MNRIYGIIIFILFILFSIFYYRQIKLNQMIEKTNEMMKVKESFEDSQKFENNLPKILHLFSKLIWNHSYF